MSRNEAYNRWPLLIALAASVILPGCSWRPAFLWSGSAGEEVESADEFVDSAAISPSQDKPAPVVTPPPQTTRAPRPAALAELEQLLTVTTVQQDPDQQPLRDEHGLVIHRRSSGWSRSETSESSYRWTHSGLARYDAIPPKQRPDLRLALESGDPGVVATATIGLARREGPRHLSALVALIHPWEIDTDSGRQLRTHDITVRRAAIETLGFWNDPVVGSALDELHARYAGGKRNASVDGGAVDSPELLEAELLEALAKHRPAGRDPRFLAALRSESNEVQAAAVQCIVADRESPLPREVSNLIAGGRSSLRVTAIEACGRRGDPSTIPQLAAATYDPDLVIRLAAIDAMGKVGGEQAISALRRILQESKTRLQEAAVLALAAAGDYQSVFDAARHQDSRVRRAAAESLGGVSDQRAAHTAAELLRDENADVQMRAVGALGKWPIERAGPLLLMASGAVLPITRQTAFSALAERWPPAAQMQHEFEYPAVGVRGEVQSLEAQRNEQRRRRELLSQLEDRWRAEFGAFPASFAASTAPSPTNHAQSPPADFRQAVAALDSPLPAERHAALQQLVEASQRTPLGPEARDAIVRAAQSEVEPGNWLLLLEAAGRCEGDVALEAAYRGLCQDLPEVRIAACRLLGERPSPAHAPHLVRLLDVHTPLVASAALEALGGCAPIDDTLPIELLLACSNPYLRVDAATALARLGVQSGSDALERLLTDRDPKVKVRAVSAIARLEDPLFLSSLMILLEHETDFSVRRAVLDALPSVTGHDVSAAKHEDTETYRTESSITDSFAWQARRWREWYYSGGRR
ncbi:MAG: HEAT repeat domain-containing protein [Pirellulaceae bacterium]